ncbi:hypothetical protein [Actinophytocola sp.]|uniref:hypothetical protein n=1 Tax=Actinophytocola sp. TaxID=1872138 RepID=UPI002D811432|nr:hypothetical protein [Actinophytocola sp.]HET9141730.1 hypothetical protein [Actinophytocola sp.]
MRKMLLSLLSLVVALGMSIISASPATAIGGESLACQVNASGLSSPECLPATAAGTYSVMFQVVNGSGSYSYSWSVPRIPVSGCTSTSSHCIISVVPSGGGDLHITGSVTITQSGQSAGLSATATIPATCSAGSWYFFC